MKRIILINIIILISISCLHLTKRQLLVEIKYIGTKEYQPDSIPDLRNDTIYLIFTSYFRGDSVNIKTKNSNQTLYLKTSEITGFSEAVTLGKVVDNQSIELAIDNYSPVTFNADRKNQIFVISYLPDSSLQIESVYKVHGFR
jgi:hypothetical protein